MAILFYINGMQRYFQEQIALAYQLGEWKVNCSLDSTAAISSLDISHLQTLINVKSMEGQLSAVLIQQINN